MSGITTNGALVSELRAQPARLRQMPLAQLAAALEQLQKAQALEEIRRRLGLSEKSLLLLLTLATDAMLQALARLLGMEQADDADVQQLRPGLWMLNAQLDYPEQLKNQIIPLFNVDPETITQEDTGRIRSIIQQQLEQAAHRIDLPFLLSCRDHDLGRRLIPDEYVALIIDEAILRDLLFAQNPQQTFAGLLLTRGLLALSPYRTEGEVKNPAMFYGRDRLLREVIQTALPQFLLVGPRRIGKTSLLRRLMEQLAKRRPELQLIHLDLLGITDVARVGRMLARRLQLPLAHDSSDIAQNAIQLAELLYERFHQRERPGVILIDEADALIEADAAAGFPLLTELRNLQSEGICSFVLTGYWYLFRRTLDHTSPVYNFAVVKRLGPLEPEAARALASEPMLRLGLNYAGEELAERIVSRAGAYPTLIQLLCDQLIEQLKEEHALILTEEHLRKAERSQRVRDYLASFFRFNTGPGAQLLIYRLLEQETFGLASAHVCLEQAAGRAEPLWTIERILLQLVLYGLVTETDDHYRWSIPLVRDTLLAGRDRAHRIDRLLQELPDDFAEWITPSA
jgi:type II secretory pathway predicted ATPase ExeA